MGYFLKYGRQRVYETPLTLKRRQKTSAIKPIHPLSRYSLKKCIEYCHSRGSKVILVTVPSYTGWSYKAHNAIAQEAKANHIPFLDLNLLMKRQLNWKTDSCDRGTHLNVYGANKTTSFLGDYLANHYNLKDHRKDIRFISWKKDLKKYWIMTKWLKKEKRKEILGAGSQITHSIFDSPDLFME